MIFPQVNNQARQSMLSRRIPVLESFFDRVNMLLWPRVKVVFDGHLKSVELANPRQLGRVSKCAHYVTRRCDHPIYHFPEPAKRITPLQPDHAVLSVCLCV